MSSLFSFHLVAFPLELLLGTKLHHDTHFTEQSTQCLLS
ncbi:hypothetical protein ABIE27_001904 [Paenibacillus sp. 4624]